MATDLTVKVFRLEKGIIDELKYYKEEFNINPSSLIRKILEVDCDNLEQKILDKTIILNTAANASRKYYAVRLQKKYLWLINELAEKYNISPAVIIRGILSNGLSKFRKKIYQRQNEIPKVGRVGKRTRKRV